MTELSLASGSTFLNAWSTSWLSWSVGVGRTKHRGIWSTAALRSPTLPDVATVALVGRAFFVRGPTVWNSLSVELREPGLMVSFGAY